MYDDETAEFKISIIGDPIFADTRALTLMCRYLNLSYNLKEVNTLRGEHRSKEFLKKYPCGYLPIL